MKLAGKRKLNMAANYCAIIYIVLLFIGWGLVGGFLPPPSPSQPIDELVRHIQEHRLRVRISGLSLMIAALVFIPFTALAADAVRRIEGNGRMLTFTILLGGMSNVALTFYPAMWWLLAAYRPELSADFIRALTDMAWLQFVGGATIYLAFPLTLSVAALVDDDQRPIFPRWFGYFNIWIAILIIPDQLVFFFYSGPFAWNGLFSFWIPVNAFVAQFALTFYFLRSAIREGKLD